MKTTLVITLFVTLIGSLSVPQSLWTQSALGNPQPGSFQSGMGVISGWVCDTEQIDIVFNPGTAKEETWRAGSRTTREDTAGVCNDIDISRGITYSSLLGCGAVGARLRKVMRVSLRL